MFCYHIARAGTGYEKERGSVRSLPSSAVQSVSPADSMSSMFVRTVLSPQMITRRHRHGHSVSVSVNERRDVGFLPVPSASRREGPSSSQIASRSLTQRES